jgi:hypothetical protein
MMKEGRYAMLAQSDPARSRQLLKASQQDADARWNLYEQIAGVHRVLTEEGGDAAGAAPPGGGDKQPAAAASQEQKS